MVPHYGIPKIQPLKLLFTTQFKKREKENIESCHKN